MDKLHALLKEHAAYLAGGCFVILALLKYQAGDTQEAAHELGLALASFGLKSGIEKVYAGLPD